MATFAAKKKRGKLDVDDMERRIVEFRVSLDREKRRCVEAQMTDKFKQLLNDKLKEFDENPQETTINSIQVQKLDNEDFTRLDSFLNSTINMCNRFEQHEMYENVLRKVLQNSRRKCLSSGPPRALEPFCLFCASDFKSCSNCKHQKEKPIDRPITCNGQLGYTAMYTGVEDQYDMAPSADTTPPPSATTTPEVGEQARGQAQDLTRDQARDPASDTLWTEHPSSEQFQRHFSQSFTSQMPAHTYTYTPNISSVQNINRCSFSANGPASTTPPMSPAPSATVSNSQQVNSTTSQTVPQHLSSNANASHHQQQQQPQQQQPQQAHQQQQLQPQPEPQPGPSSDASAMVPPSDVSDFDSHSSSDSHDEVRKICTNLGAYQLPNGGGLRSSTPLSDRMHRSEGKLVIDESVQTPIKRRPKTKLGANHSLGSNARVTTNGPPASSTGGQLEQVSSRLRSEVVKKKHQPKRGLSTKRF